VLGLTATFKKAANRFAAANTSGSIQALATSSRAFGRQAHAFATGLRRLKAPANVARAQSILVGVLFQFSKDLYQLSTDAFARDVKAIVRDTTKIQNLGPKLRAAEAAIGG
jgi:hypothetical protein